MVLGRPSADEVSYDFRRLVSASPFAVVVGDVTTAHPPRNPALENEDDPGQTGAVVPKDRHGLESGMKVTLGLLHDRPFLARQESPLVQAILAPCRYK